MLPGSIPRTVIMIHFRSILSIALLLLTSGCSLLSPSFHNEEAVFTDEVEPLQGQLFLPRNIEQPVAAVVVVHGGGWAYRCLSIQQGIGTKGHRLSQTPSLDQADRKYRRYRRPVSRKSIVISRPVVDTDPAACVAPQQSVKNPSRG